MKQLRDYPIDDAKYYERIWNAELAAGHWHFDAVRHRALAKYVKPGHKVIDIGAGVWGTAQYIGTELKTPNVTLVAYDQSYTARDIVRRCVRRLSMSWDCRPVCRLVMLSLTL